MEQSYKEFRSKLLRRRGKGKYGNCLHERDILKIAVEQGLLKIDREITPKEYRIVVKTVNAIAAEEIIKGEPFELPCRMGRIEARPIEVKSYFKDGKLVVTNPINWEATYKLWYEDEEAKKNKLYVRYDEGVCYRIIHNKRCANYQNRTIYKFIPNRILKANLAHNVKEGKVNTLHLIKKEVV